MNAPRLIGILGGTFDPVHLGHLALAQAALAQLPLTEVLWLPSGSPGIATRPWQARATVSRCCASRPQPMRAIASTRASSIAANRPTACTRSRLRAQTGKAQPLVLLLGSDSFLSLPTWLRWRELFDLAHFAVATRPGQLPVNGGPLPDLSEEIARRSARPEQLTGSAAGRVARFDMPPMDISSSAVRAKLAAGEDVRNLLPGAVLAYIGARRLYLEETRKT